MRQNYSPITGGFGYRQATQSGMKLISASDLWAGSALERDIERAAERVLLRRIIQCPMQ